MPSQLHPDATCSAGHVTARAASAATRALRCALLAPALLGVWAAPARSESPAPADTPAAPLIAPALTLEKSGPPSAIAGELVTYRLAITNSGGTAFDGAAIAVADPQCQAPPALLTRNGDASPGTLEPGETWTYSCQVATRADQQSVEGSASVTGADSTGTTVSAAGSASTTLAQPVSRVLPRPAVRGVTAAARLQGTSGCATGAFARATVSGTGIRSVTFHVNGRRVRTTRGPDGGKYELKLAVRALRLGAHSVTARVVFVARARTAPRTLRMRFVRCAARVVRPTFAG